jgi:CDP-glycerol glycerophosphotransferase (TagB/SpsB family)
MSEVRYLRGPRHRRPSWPVRALARHAAAGAVGLLDQIVPKKPRRVVLGSDKGCKYNGNSRHLFEHLVQREGWDAYWLTESPEIYDAVSTQYPGRAVKAWSLRALRIGLTARWLAFSHSRYDLGPFAYLLRRRFVYLNHGVPLKAMGFAKAYKDPATPDTARTLGAVTCCSPFEASLWSRAYRIPLDRMWITGVPRNDRLFVRDRGIRNRLEIKPGQRIVLFAPTYRESGLLADYLPLPGLDRQALIDLLRRRDAVLLIRPHYYESTAARAMVAEMASDHVRIADEAAVADVNDLLPDIDVLVTDYSSIFFDFLLLDRPIIFSCADRTEYERDRGFMIDYDSNTPGEKVRTGPEFLIALDDVLSGRDRHRDFRAEVRDRFHRFADANSSARIARHMAEKPAVPAPQPELG